MCRAPCFTVTDPKPNVVLSALISAAFPGQEVSTPKEDGALAAAETSARVLPLFLSSSVQLPHATCYLHLFEPRYRLLSHRALDSGGDFAMVWVRHGAFPVMEEPAALAGVTACLVHIEQSQQTMDGRFNLLCKGMAAARIEECWVEEGTGGLYMARLLALEEVELPPHEAEAAGGGSGGAREAGSGPPVPDADAPLSQQVQYIAGQMQKLGLAAQAPASPLEVARFSWEAAAGLYGPFGYAGLGDIQSLLDQNSVKDRIAQLCGLYRQAWDRRWSLQGLVRSGLGHARPILGVLAIAWLASAIGSWGSREGA